MDHSPVHITALLYAACLLCGPAAIPVYAAEADSAVSLLLHGTNSGPETWNDLARDYFSGRCTTIRMGVELTAKRSCYRYQFADAIVAGRVWPKGDGSSFTRLGREVRLAVRQINRAVRPAAIILVGHSRGGLAARAYIQALARAPRFRLALASIGTPHQGTPFGRIKHWMDRNGHGPNDTVSELRFVFSPSVGDMATSHDSAGVPVRSSISEKIWRLNDGAPALGQWVSAFGEIRSGGLRLGENAYGDYDVLDNDLGTLAFSFLSPGSFNKMRRYVLYNIGALKRRTLRPDRWSCNRKDLTPSQRAWSCSGDGIVPAVSQRLSKVPGFDRGGKPYRVVTLSSVPHTGQTGQTARIGRLLERLRADLADAATAPGAAAALPTLRKALPAREAAAAEAARSSTAAELESDLREAWREGDDVLLNAARNEIVVRGRRGALESVQVLVSALEGAPAGLGPYYVGLLGEIATPAAARALIDLAQSSPGSISALRLAALEALAHIGEHQAGKRSVASISTLLETHLESVVFSDPGQAVTIAEGLASLGTPSGIDAVLQLLDAYAVDPAIPIETRQALSRALGQVRNPAAVPVLQARLRADPELNRAATSGAAEALARMGHVRATQALLGWASELSGEPFARQALAWLSLAREEGSLRLLGQAGKRIRFRDAQLLARIRNLARHLEAGSRSRLLP